VDRCLTVDVGGSKVAVALVIDGQARSIEEYPTPASYEEFSSHLKRIVQSSCVQGTAIATAGIVNNHRTVIQSPNVQWLNGLHLAHLTEQLTYRRCWVVNDLEAVTMAELRFGALRDVQCGIVESLSTGWGGCTGLRLNDRDYVIPGEPGHVNVGTHSYVCGCGQIGCAEAAFSGGAVRRRIRERFGIRLSDSEDPCSFLDREADTGAEWALQLYDEVATGIGYGWANALNRNSWIKKIIYTGTFAVRGMRYMRLRIEKTIREHTKFPHHKEISIGRSLLWPVGAHLGAAVLFMQCQQCHDRLTRLRSTKHVLSPDVAPDPKISTGARSVKRTSRKKGDGQNNGRNLVHLRRWVPALLRD